MHNLQLRAPYELYDLPVEVDARGGLTDRGLFQIGKLIRYNAADGQYEKMQEKIHWAEARVSGEQISVLKSIQDSVVTQLARRLFEEEMPFYSETDGSGSSLPMPVGNQESNDCNETNSKVKRVALEPSGVLMRPHQQAFYKRNPILRAAKLFPFAGFGVGIHLWVIDHSNCSEAYKKEEPPSAQGKTVRRLEHCRPAPLQGITRDPSSS